MQEDNHIFQGLRRDNHQIRQDASFLWDAHNIRLTNREDNTLLSLTNEKGTSNNLSTFQGQYVGHCVLGKYLVIFTATDSGENYIYRVEKDGTSYRTIILFYSNSEWNEAWDAKHPIEAIGVYETELVQKVYWVDGINQPRVINITKPEYKLSGTKYEQVLSFKQWDYSGEAPGPNSTTNNTFNQSISRPIGVSPVGWLDFINEFEEKVAPMYSARSLNFVQHLALKETVNVNRVDGGGLFSPGTIQYAFSYYNKYEQETNIFYTTPLYYISPSDRGGNPEEAISNIFNIKISNIDRFDYIRVYSIHRTSIDADPTVKVLGDIPTELINEKDPFTYSDDGTKGYTIDPTQLLYIGGTNILAGTIAQKDHTLFLGNITLNTNPNIESIVSNSHVGTSSINLPDTYNNLDQKSSFYNYNSPLARGNLAGFKSREKYRCGVQVQTEDGIWSNPIFMEDMVLCNSHPMNGKRTSKAFIFSNLDALKNAGVKRMRSCVVFPRAYERDVICQGVLCPTVFSAAGRKNDLAYAQSSWFFRPASTINSSDNAYKGASIQFLHNTPLLMGSNRGAEIQNMVYDVANPVSKVNDIDTTHYDLFKSYYFVDENIVTFHSPDIEFDTQLQNIDWSNTKLRIIGMAKLDAISGDIDIQTSSPAPSGAGFVHTQVGYKTGSNNFINGGLVSGLFYESGGIYTQNNNYGVGAIRTYMVYPWHRSGSLNNDSNRSDESTRTAVLSKKVISNLKFFSDNYPLDEEYNYDISTPQLFNDNELSIIKIKPSYLGVDIVYLGNVDSLVTTGKSYPFFTGTNVFNSVITEESNATENTSNTATSSDPVRIKYKSTPHLVFSLSGGTQEIKLLPSNLNFAPALNEDYEFPDWQNTGSLSGPGTVTHYKEFSFIDCNVLNDMTEDTLIAGAYAYEKVEGGYTILRCDAISGGTVKKWNSYRDFAGEEFKITASTEIGKHSDYEVPGGIPEPGNYNLVKAVTRGNLMDSSGKYYLYYLEPYIKPRVARTSPISYTLTREVFDNTAAGPFPFLLLAELTREVPEDIKFGGTLDLAKQQNLWIPAGRPVNIPDTITSNSSILVPFEYGDTWYSRYDCLKTYPFTKEDENQIVEIGSFLCETRVNIDGRYDRNRGQTSNLNMSPQNFNHLNEVYSQKDNFFKYRILDKDYYKQQVFANQITWSKEKSLGEEIDTWSNITLANTLDMDGEVGKVTAIRTLNENIVCFQEKAISQLMFNSRVQVPVSDGVPIEISNGYKMDGSRLISGNVGCPNKWTIADTSMGLYFIDTNTDNLYLFNGQLARLSEANGMNWWTRQNHTTNIWNPISYSTGLNGIRTFYDNKYSDLYFTPGPSENNQPDALCYSEQLNQFVSLMSYGGTQAMFNFADGFYSLRHTGNNKLGLYQNHVGQYNKFYGVTKGWDFSFISNQNPAITKIFDTIELRTDHYDTVTFSGGSKEPELLNSCPINFIKVDNEYQDSDEVAPDMKKKFRVWRGLIPRNAGTRQRIRNQWAKITLGWKPEEHEFIAPELDSRKAVIHDASVKYTV